MSKASRKIRTGSPALLMEERQKRLLTEYSQKRGIPHHHKLRLGLLLSASSGKSHNLISREGGTTVKRVKHWRNKWSLNYEALLKYEVGELGEGVKEHDLLKEMLKRVEDEPRSGAPVRISESQKSQKSQIVGLACEDPSDYGLPQTVWTYKLLQEVIIEKGILDALHERTVGKILKNAEVATAQKRILVISEDKRLGRI